MMITRGLCILLWVHAVQGFESSALFDAIDAGKTDEAMELLETVEHPDKYETFTKDSVSANKKK